MSEAVSAAPAPKARRLSPARKTFYIGFIGFAAVLVYWLLWKGLAPFRVPSDSMIPTLLAGDFIFALPQPDYKRGDIVVLHDPLQDGFLVKRIVGVAGDTIDVNYGYLSINGKYASEPYIHEPMAYIMEPQQVAEGEVLVLGDNRNESDDASRWLINPETGEAIDASRIQSDVVDGKRWKRTVPAASIVGKVVFRYLPFDRFGPIDSFPLTNTEGE